MAGIDDVLERLLTDTRFAKQLATDPVAALAGYELSPDDMSLLSTQISFDPGAMSLVEERVSKAGMFGLLTSFSAGLGSIVGPDHSLGSAIDPADHPSALVGPTDLGNPGGTHGIIIVNSIGNPDLNPADAVGFNPQPDIPGAPASTTGGIVNPGTLQGFNPQPDIPGAPASTTGGIVNPGTLQGFNPQPDIPGAPASTTGGIVNPGTLQGFNPQPDIPGAPATGDAPMSPHITVQGGTPLAE